MINPLCHCGKIAIDVVDEEGRPACYAHRARIHICGAHGALCGKSAAFHPTRIQDVSCEECIKIFKNPTGTVTPAGVALDEDEERLLKRVEALFRSSWRPRLVELVEDLEREAGVKDAL